MGSKANNRNKIETAIRQINLRLDKFDEFIQNYSADQSELLKTKIEFIEPLLKEHQSRLLELECLDSSYNNQAAIDYYETEFEDKYSRLISRARTLMPRQNSTPVSQFINQSSVECKVRLPTIGIPNFSGAYEEWSEFRDTFYALVHNNENLLNVQKFHYLKTALKGDAAKVIHSLEVNDANYLIAWDLLKERYENVRMIANGHIRAIFDLNPITKENHNALRNLTDTLVRNLRCLKALQLPTEQWDALIIYVITSKLDAITKRDFESSLSSREMPKLEQLKQFLNERCNLLETIQGQGKDSLCVKNTVESNSKRREKVQSFTSTTSTGFKCSCCNNEKHGIFRCDKFASKSVEERRNFVKANNLCYNCLRPGHAVRDCRSRNCYKCNAYHHSLLHVGKNMVKDETKQETIAQTTTDVQVTESTSSKENNLCQLASLNTCQLNHSHNTVLLSTANIYVEDNDGNRHECRALLDSGSQGNIISENLANILQLKKNNVHSVISGIGSSETQIRYSINATIKSIHSNFKQNINCLVMNRITDNIPTISFDASSLNIPTDIKLADRNFNKNLKIDILLGAAVFWDVLQNNQIHLGKQKPRLQQTQLGYVLAGCMYPQKVMKTHALCALSEQLSKFWIQEDVAEPVISSDDKECEKIYNETTTREKSGRFVVNIPFRENLEFLGDSRESALKRFSALERRFTRDADLGEQYKIFMYEYETLGHMTRINESKQCDQNYYLAHHAVIKSSSNSTKLRTVFDGSAKTSSGISLNDVQFTGPTVQSELFSI